MKGIFLSLSLLSLLTSCCCKSGCPVTEYTPYCVIDFDEYCPPIVEEEVVEEPIGFTFFSHDDVYHLAKGDHLRVSIYDENDLSVEQVVVAADGKIYVPLLEGIDAEGYTTDKLAQKMEEELQSYLLNPMVAITPNDLNSHSYTVLGRVNRPGLYPITHDLTLRDAIAEAGGFVKDPLRLKDADPRYRSLANLSQSFIVRDHQKLPIDFERLMFTPDNAQNVQIEPGDYIYVAPYEEKEVYVVGAVSQNRAVPFVRGLTLMGALTASGGWTRFAPQESNPHKILVVRGSLECPCVFLVDVCKILNAEGRDLYLVPGDIVYVPETPLPFMRELVRLAIASFVAGFGSSAGDYYGGFYGWRR
ncbi:MAG: polysaccharide export protein [Chlamydiia bacterium]|nr:polysaccharide export protein [Chlamydiia bacterium]